jgi:hypothetical protein
MKNLLLVFAMAIMMASCTKQANNKFAPEKMNGVEFTAKYKFELPYLDYSNNLAGRGSKPKANAVQLSVTEDLEITGSISCTTSADAEWGGIQKFLAEPLSNDGAVSYCNFNWSYIPAASLMDCPTTISGVYRGWTSDKADTNGDRNVHLSATKTIP